MTDKTPNEQRIFFHRGWGFQFSAWEPIFVLKRLIYASVWVFGNREDNEYIFLGGLGEGRTFKNWSKLFLIPCSFIHTQQPSSENASIRTTRRKHQIKLVRTIAMAIAAFVLSWSPYCFVSIIATIRGTNTLTPGEAEIPDLLAKASVIYNPIVYTAMNDKFRASLPHVIPCFRYCLRDYRSSVISRSNSRSREYEANTNTAERKRHSQFKPHHDGEICWEAKQLKKKWDYFKSFF